MRDTVTAEVLAAAVAATDAGVLVCDRGLPDTPVVFANDGFCRMTGYPREEVLGRNCRFLQGPGTDRDAVARLRDAIAAGRPVEAELLNYRRDGGPFWNALRIGPVADGDGPARFLVGVLHDVTGRRRAEDRVADLGRRLDALAASGVVGIMVAEGERIVEANAEFLRTVGYGPEDLAAGGLHWPSMTPPEWRERSRRGEEDAVVGGASRPYEKEYLRKDGGRVPVLIGAVALDRSRRRRMCLVLDLSERKRAEERVRHLAHHDPLTGLPNRALFHDRLRRRWRRPAPRRAGRAAAARPRPLQGRQRHARPRRRRRAAARGRPRASSAACARATRSPGSAATSSRSSCRASPAAPRPRPSRRRSGRRWPSRWRTPATPSTSAPASGSRSSPATGRSRTQLLKNADIALYRAKAEGRGTYRFFVPDMRRQVERRRELEDELRPGAGAGRAGAVLPAQGAARRRPAGRLRGAGALAPPDARPGHAGRVPAGRRGGRAGRGVSDLVLRAGGRAGAGAGRPRAWALAASRSTWRRRSSAAAGWRGPCARSWPRRASRRAA